MVADGGKKERDTGPGEGRRWARGGGDGADATVGARKAAGPRSQSNNSRSSMDHFSNRAL